MKENIHAGHRERLKNQILSSEDGAKIPHIKLLEMLLFYGIPQKDTSGIAYELLKSFGSLAGVLEADIDELVKVDGISPKSAKIIYDYFRGNK